MATLLNVGTWDAARREKKLSAAWKSSIASIEQEARNNPAFAMVEARFRQIAARCLDIEGPAHAQSLAITSASAGEGKSSVAVGIAMAAAQNLGTDVMIIETDLSKPQLTVDFDLVGAVGLSEYLSSEVPLESIIHQTRVPHVWLIPAGRTIKNPGPLVRSKRFSELMAGMRGVYQTIIIDTPPLLTSPDAAVIARQAQGIVYVARAGRTHVDDAASALALAGDVPVRGVVLNGTRLWLPAWASRLLGVSRFAIE